MASIHERLRWAAWAGSEIEIRALLREPGCDALDQDDRGLTALMWAARNGYEECVRLLLPVSDALVQDKEGWTALMWAAWNGHEGCLSLLLPTSDALAENNNGFTASGWAAGRGHESLARLIDAYALAQKERVALEAQVGPGTPRGRAVRRV